jgi:hypothetical protein
MKARYESKYLISKQEKVAVEDYISEFCIKDINSVNGQYSVNSIYFDTKDYRSLHEKLDGNQMKTKYRLRYYNGNSNEMNAEIKIKEGIFSKKETYQIKTAERLCQNSIVKNNNNEFVSKILIHQLEPKLHIKYKREAYISKIKSDLRITFDSNLEYKTNCSEKNDENLIPYPMIGYIMEIKYSESNFWILKILADLIQKKVSFSKYCNTLQLSQKKN